MLPNDDIAFYKDLAASKPPRRRNYVVRHWRGELSLPVSFWINGMLLTAVITTFGHVVGPRVTETGNVWASFLLLCGLLTLSATAAIWQATGIWRAAGNHKTRHGGYFWAGVARFMVIVSCLVVGWQFAFVNWPVFRTHLSIIDGDEAMGPFKLRLLNGGTEIEYAGAIRFGAADELEKMLRASPQVKVIHFNSQGGRLVEARRIRDVIRQAGLVTYVRIQCLSACTVAYLGGHKRYAHGDARLGFHAGKIEGVPELVTARENQRVVREAAEAGIDPDFAARAYLSPADSMWFPPMAELIRVRFVTEPSQGQFALTDAPDLTRADIDRSLKKVPVYQTIAQYEPTVFDTMAEIYRDGAAKGLPEIEVVGRMQQQAESLLLKYLPFASDEAVLLFARVIVGQMQTIGARDKAACHDLAMDEKPVDVQRYLTPEQIEDNLTLLDVALRTGSQRVGTLPSEARSETLFATLMQQLEQRHGLSALHDLVALNKGTLPRDRTCAVVAQLYLEILRFPQTDAVAMIRHLLVQ